MQYLSFWDWLISLSIRTSGLIHIIAYVKISFFLFIFLFLKAQHVYILIHNRNTKHYSKLMAIKYGISFALYDIWLTSLVINECLETSNEDVDIPRGMGKKKNRRK